ncbi:MAG: hypothetical protein ABI175_19905, partial [Polyangiales bacterium]
MKLAAVAASLSLTLLLAACATSVDEFGGTGSPDTSVAKDAGGDISVTKDADTAVPPRDTAVTPTDTKPTTIDAGADTSVAEDTEPGFDTEPADTEPLPDTLPPPFDGPAGTC